MRKCILLILLGAVLGAAPLAAAPAPVVGPDPAAARDALLVTVARGGLQRLSGAALAAAGLDLAALAPGQLWLRRAGLPVPVELRDGGDGRLDPADELRFYAPPPGDRWNTTETYWLTVEPASAPAMAVRSVAPAAAPERTTARELGVAYAPARYDSRRPGSDGDHWFAADLRAEPGAPAAQALTLTPLLPAAPGDTIITVSGQLYAGEVAQIGGQLGAASASAAWTGQGIWTSDLALAGGATDLALTLSSLGGPVALLLDRVGWERPAALSLGGGGARFSGVDGRWRYAMAGLPQGWSLYDVTDPAAPQRLETGGGAAFEDGPAPRAYLVAGPGTLFEPALAPWRAVDLATPRSADVVYIVPEALRAALAPLVAHREAQGYAVAVVSAEAIYGAWSHGDVDPEAVRAFLRYAGATWAQAPGAVVLVGDGSADPHDWTARGPNNVNLIPPYLAAVDPWLGEAACDTCYGRLATDDPRDQPLPDLAVGRLPVKSAAELTALVEKLIAYESGPRSAPWRGTLALIAEEPDTAGDFAAEADAAAAMAPPGARVRRVYYDPTGARGPATAADAHAQTRQAFEAGAAVLIYHGHSHQWQWALTDPSAEQSALLGLYDADSLANVGRLPVVLAMTCLSSAFQTPARSGTTVDERLLLAPGGAAAVWGPAGFGVAHGHAQLQRGFFAALRAAPDGRATLGELTGAGYSALAATGAAGDALFTYILLGDPLTPLQFSASQSVMLPLVRR